MPIVRPGKVLLKNVPLEFVAKKVTGHGGKPLDASIPLVPFIDFLITLVVFLLTSFSASGELTLPAVQMPQAQNAVDLETAPIVAITSQMVSLDGRRVGDTASLAANPQVERIEPLIQDLETTKRNWSILRPNEPFQGRIIIVADKTIDFRVIKKVLFSATQAGYANINFAVNKRGG